MELNLFDDGDGRQPVETIADGAVILRGVAAADAPRILSVVDDVAAVSPFRRMETPGGYLMSVAITACGDAGWITDRAGYRYSAIDPVTGSPWPAMPRLLATLAADAASQAGYDGFAPDTCLINRYEPGARMSLHQDRNERSIDQPIVSVSLGLPATFLFGGKNRADKTTKHRLEHGDIVVWGGVSRLNFHGVNTLKDGDHPLLGRRRINLTFRKAL